MERRLNKRAEVYVTTFKDDIRERAVQLGLGTDIQTNTLLQYIYDYNRLSFGKDDFQKRKRVKNFVPMFDRCCAKRANNEQCTRRRKDGCEYCGTHIKGTPHGIVDIQNDSKANTKSIEVWTEDIQGIMYYVDNCNNVYQAEDIMLNKVNPKIIAKYMKIGDVYHIPEFNV
jgi:hypothetical protein